jgi:hypothetical protein
MAKQVAKRPPSGLPATEAFASHAGSGLQNVSATDLLIPRLTILQALSPQLDKKKAEYVENGAIGDVCDVGTGDLFPDGIVFLPVFYRKDYLEWAPRASGKGLVKIHTDPDILNQCTRDERNRPILPSGNYIAETAQFFGLNLSADGRKSFIPMASTQLKKARGWLTVATGEKLSRADGSTYMPPLFYRAYKLTTAEESNNEGAWAGWKITRGPCLPDMGEKPWEMDWPAIMEDCVAFMQSLVAGEANVNLDHLNTETATEERM